MAGSRPTRVQAGSGPWIAEERNSAVQIAQSEVEEFSFSARNDLDWLNEHMADIFSENQINVAELLKTPGKLRGKTPRTIRKPHPGEARVPLSDIFSATPRGGLFSNHRVERHQNPRAVRIKVAADLPPHSDAQAAQKTQQGRSDAVNSHKPGSPAKVTAFATASGDSGHRNQPVDPVHVEDNVEAEPTPQERPERHEEPYRKAHEVSSTAHKDDYESTTPLGSPASASKANAADKIGPVEPASPVERPELAIERQVPHPTDTTADVDMDIPGTGHIDKLKSASAASSPTPHIVRKSSLNFASLPAREPINHMSIGNRISRNSNLEQNRTSFFNRQTGGKSLGQVRAEETDDDVDVYVDEDEVEEDDTAPIQASEQAEANDAIADNQTYTQRLPDRIGTLGQAEEGPSCAFHVLAASATAQQSTAPYMTPYTKAPSPFPQTHTTPRTFSADDDDWIHPLGTPDDASAAFSPRPNRPHGRSADVVGGACSIGPVDGPMTAAATGTTYLSPGRPVIPERTTSKLGHHHSTPVPPLARFHQPDSHPFPDGTGTISKPAPTAVFEETTASPRPKSPSRGPNDNAVAHVKNKFSSLLKSSNDLLASSAAISAEGKSSLISPSSAIMAVGTAAVADQYQEEKPQPLYPDLTKHTYNSQAGTGSSSPTRIECRKTRSSSERERDESRRKENDADQSQRVAAGTQDTAYTRDEGWEMAGVFGQQQQILAEQAKQVVSQNVHEATPVPAVTTTPGDKPRATRTSPRKLKAQLEAEEWALEEAAVASADSVDSDGDTEMMDVPATISRKAGPRFLVPTSATKGREVIKRPTRPTKEPVSKAKQAPTVIRVNMGPQHSHFHSNSGMPSNLGDSIGPAVTQSQTQAQPPFKAKGGQPGQVSSQAKPSAQSLKNSQSGRPKALELAARRKEQEEREAQRKREAKAEIERKRAALQEEERRQEQERKREAERQKEEERKLAAAQAEAKKNAQRQAMIERAKQTRAPPPAPRPQLNSQSDNKKGEAPPSRPPSRLNSTAHRSQEDLSRSVITGGANGTKTTAKRQLQQEGKESKRMRMSDESDDDMDEDKHHSLKGAPVRPSGGFKKVAAATMIPQGSKSTKQVDLGAKAMFPVGYASSAAANPARDLFKATVTSQHHTHAKAAHSSDMAHVTKSINPFASNPNTAGSAYRTPARPGLAPGAKSAVKSAARSSPRFQNGEYIELEEIMTDEEDNDSDEERKKKERAALPSWTDSPELRKALAEQEYRDPQQIFGAPAPINMEEVFNKNKDRWSKFRPRTSSANWSGADRLTDDDIRKNNEAREKMRREGGWTYEMSNDLL